MKENKVLRKVYCKATIDDDEQLYWSYKDDSLKEHIPEIVYKVDNYEMVEIETKAIFKRWATSFDL